MLERLSWKRLALELFLACIPALILVFVGHLSWFLLGGSDRFADLAFLEFDAPVVVAVGGPEHDSSGLAAAVGSRCCMVCTRCRCVIKASARAGSLIKRFRSGAESLPDAVVLTTEEGLFSA